MNEDFQPGGLPVLIGSLPLSDHEEAIRLVFDYTPDIPLWPQLPCHAQEGMMAQFLPGMPGIVTEAERQFVDTDSPAYEDELVRFYEDYMSVVEGERDLDGSRFALVPDSARGFFTFLDHVRSLQNPPLAVKGQVTGPITFTLGIKDQNDRSIFYDPQTRDTAVKLLALKARWQVQMLSRFRRPVILFLDEPALAGFGSSEMISISREEIAACLGEVVDAVRSEGGLAGIHVCANTDWSLALDGAFDIVNFDAYAYFDKFILYPDLLKRFLASDGILVWGIVPTLSAENLDGETTDTLVARWESHARALASLGSDTPKLLQRSLISPSCGAGSLDRERAVRVLELTKAVSAVLRRKWQPA
jgi:methionine synthase II (cobalamin-independent)